MPLTTTRGQYWHTETGFVNASRCFCLTQMLFREPVYRPSLCLTSRSLKNKWESARLKIISSILRPRVTAIGGSWAQRIMTSSTGTTKYFFHSHRQILLPVSKVASLPPTKNQNSTPVFTHLLLLLYQYTPPPPTPLVELVHSTLHSRC